MKKISSRLKYVVYGISGLIFFILSFGLAPKLVAGLIELISKTIGYHFGISTNPLDYLAFSLIPVFGLFYNSTRIEFKTAELIQDIITVLLSVLIVFGIGLFLMIYLGKNSNPLIPETLLVEPFNLYSTILIVIGIALPYVILRVKK